MKSTATKKQVYDRVKELGGFCKPNPDGVEVLLPPGKALSSSPDLHGFPIIFDVGDGGKRAEAWGDALERLADGAEDCTNEYCDVCDECKEPAIAFQWKNCVGCKFTDHEATATGCACCTFPGRLDISDDGLTCNTRRES